MKIKFELDPDETLVKNINIAAAFINADRIYLDDLEEIAQYLLTYVEYAKRPRPVYVASKPVDPPDIPR